MAYPLSNGNNKRTGREYRFLFRLKYNLTVRLRRIRIRMRGVGVVVRANGIREAGEKGRKMERGESKGCTGYRGARDIAR